MPEKRCSLIPTAPTLHTLFPRPGGLLFQTPITTLHTLWPKHDGLSFPPPLPYIRYDRDTVVSHSLRPNTHTRHSGQLFRPPYLTYAMSETRWSLIPTALSLYILSPRHSGLSFPPPLPFAIS